ncbi:unnamed protein product [Heterosigma akashiwo]
MALDSNKSVDENKSALAKSSLSVDKVLESLGEPEKYNAVLQGLANILVEEPGSGRSFNELGELLREMRERKIRPTARSLAAAVDAAAALGDCAALGSLLPELKAAGAGQVFGRALPRLTPLPVDPAARAKALKGLEPVPQDERSKEVTASLAFLGLVGADFGWQTVGALQHSDSPLPQLVLAALFGGLAYDLVSGAGQVSGSVAAGLNRLLVKDFEREARCEAAAFLVGYALGLPCFPFRPNVLEALRLVQEAPPGDGLRTPAGAARLLAWLAAPAAAEQQRHPQLVVADPRQPAAFLRLLRDRGLVPELADSGGGGSEEEGGGGDGGGGAPSDEERVLWAFAEARRVLAAEEFLFDSLQLALESGAASVGECVAILEEGFVL